MIYDYETSKMSDLSLLQKLLRGKHLYFQS